MEMKIMRGQILKDLRTSKHLKQSEMSDFLGVSQQAYQKYEYGTAEPTFDSLVKLADFYNVSTDYLLGRTTVKAMAKPAEGELTEEEITEIEKDIVSSYTALPVETRRACIQALTTVLGDVFDIEEQTENEPLTEDPEELAQ